jgi:hypothetical protein
MRKLHLPIDEYEVRARLFPALLITLPALAAFWVLWPTARSVAGIAAGSAIESAVIFWLTKIARDQGKKIERNLFEKWGGKPTTIVLRWSDSHFDVFTKERYRKTLATMASLTLPSKAEESNDPVRADQAYESCVRALLEKRRGITHRLIFNENCNYGFVRNLLGLKMTGILIALASISVELILWRKHGFSPTDTVLLPGVIAILVLSLLTTFATRQAAQRTAMAYADALLRSCEPAMSRSRVSREKD